MEDKVEEKVTYTEDRLKLLLDDSDVASFDKLTNKMFVPETNQWAVTTTLVIREKGGSIYTIEGNAAKEQSTANDYSRNALQWADTVSFGKALAAAGYGDGVTTGEELPEKTESGAPEKKVTLKEPPCHKKEYTVQELKAMTTLDLKHIAKKLELEGTKKTELVKNIFASYTVLPETNKYGVEIPGVRQDGRSRAEMEIISNLFKAHKIGYESLKPMMDKLQLEFDPKGVIDFLKHKDPKVINYILNNYEEDK